MNPSTPKQAGFFMPAEWHPHERCWMAWPSHEQTWSKIGLDRARLAYAQVANAIAQYEPVTMLVKTEDKNRAMQLCESNINFYCLPLDDSWTRDTGCTFLLNDKGELGGVDWIHNAWGGNYDEYQQDQNIAGTLINETKAQYFKAPLVMEGGSFHVDGRGSVLTTRECLLNINRNPKLSETDISRYLIEYLGAEHIIWLNKGLVADETNGHIDEVATFIAPGKVLCLITQDKEDPNYNILQENFSILSTARDAKGRALELFTVEQPPAVELNGERLTLSYINYYLANGGIVMPAFGFKEYDDAAYKLFKKIFPDYALSQIDALDVFAGGGGIHCITQQQPKSFKSKP